MEGFRLHENFTVVIAEIVSYCGNTLLRSKSSLSAFTTLLK